MCGLNEAERRHPYDGFIGCGGLFLASKMVSKMNLKSVDIVLDLGSGFGGASVHLARHFDITVVSVDLWHSSEGLTERSKRGVTWKNNPVSA